MEALLGSQPHWGWLALGLLLAVYLLPPDTSLAEVKRVGVLKVCIPTEHPPLVTGKADSPGFDVELLGLE